MKIELDERELSRVLSALRERQRKFKKSIDKFGDDFDPEKGESLLEGAKAYTLLIRKIQEQV